MPNYSNNNVPNLTQLRTTTAFLITLLQALESRIDIQTTASTDADADYAAEVVDARVDAWANTNNSLGASIRNGQLRLLLGLQAVQESHQEQIDEVAEAQIDLATIIPRFITQRTQELITQEESRVMDDNSLQHQIDELSGAILNIALQISEIRRKLT